MARLWVNFEDFEHSMVNAPEDIVEIVSGIVKRDDHRIEHMENRARELGWQVKRTFSPEGVLYIVASR